MSSRLVSHAKEAVRAYWEASPCGSSLTQAEPGSKAFFDDIEATRYRLEPFIPEFADFERWRGKFVLEIGVGLGTDFVRFGRAGAKLSGIDLTEASIELVRTRLELEGLDADLRVADAEALPFANGTFDLAYSWGVIHHTPNPHRAVAEIRRVLKPDGEARVMLYSRRSWFAFGAWIRYAVLRGVPWHSIAKVLSEHLESPDTKAYTRAELRALFREFANVSFTHFSTTHDRRIVGPIADVIGDRLGWFIGVTCQP
jgi:ubiquinone/menaquinone biosynthesis C-methylase UbiE